MTKKIYQQKFKAEGVGNFTTRALTNEEYKEIIRLLRSGFITKEGKKVRKNKKVEVALMIEACSGLRVSDTTTIRLKDIIKESDNRYRFNYIEKKTNKLKTTKISKDMYKYLYNYCKENNISDDEAIVSIGIRQVEKHLKKITDYLGLDGISTHSFRKKFALDIFECDEAYNIYLVKEALNHSCISISERYIKNSSKQLEKVLDKVNNLI